MDKNIRISELQVLLDNSLGNGAWVHLEPETLLIELGCRDYLVAEKLYVLKILNVDLNRAVSSPEFLLWCTSVCNNEFADFETINLPTCLELAWCIYEVRRIATITGQKFEPTEELIDIVSYLLTLEGFSHAPAPFEFIPTGKLTLGQTEQDVSMKTAAITSYISHMRDAGSYSEPIEESESSDSSE